MSRWLRLSADRLVDGTERQPILNGAVLVKDGRIAATGNAAEVPYPEGAEHETFPGCTLLPGLVDCHSHLNLPGDGTAIEEAVAVGDELLVLQSAKNARLALYAGVTTLRDNGARNRTAFSLRSAQRSGLVEAPRLSIAGRPLTITGGHCWPFGGEADGEASVRQAVRQLVKEGVDWIKVIGTGGGTRNTLPYRASYSAVELAAAVEEAHAAGRLAAMHATGTAGIVRALDAGFDMLIHGYFYEPDGTHQFQRDLATRIAHQGVWVNPTLHVGRSRIHRLEQRATQHALTVEEQADLDHQRSSYEERRRGVAGLIEAGARVVAGSDSGWSFYRFGAFPYEVEALSSAGMGAAAALRAATLDSARAMGLDHEVGSLEPGKLADALVVEGDPTVDPLALKRVRRVFLGGIPVGGR